MTKLQVETLENRCLSLSKELRTKFTIERAGEVFGANFTLSEKVLRWLMPSMDLKFSCYRGKRYVIVNRKAEKSYARILE